MKNMKKPIANACSYVLPHKTTPTLIFFAVFQWNTLEASISINNLKN